MSALNRSLCRVVLVALSLGGAQSLSCTRTVQVAQNERGRYEYLHHAVPGSYASQEEIDRICIGQDCSRLCDELRRRGVNPCINLAPSCVPLSCDANRQYITHNCECAEGDLQWHTVDPLADAITTGSCR